MSRTRWNTSTLLSILSLVVSLAALVVAIQANNIQRRLVDSELQISSSWVDLAMFSVTSDLDVFNCVLEVVIVNSAGADAVITGYDATVDFAGHEEHLSHFGASQSYLSVMRFSPYVAGTTVALFSSWRPELLHQDIVAVLDNSAPNQQLLKAPFVVPANAFLTMSAVVSVKHDNQMNMDLGVNLFVSMETSRGELLQFSGFCSPLG